MTKVADLTGVALDYWVAKALGHNVIMFAGAPKVMDWQKAGSLVRGNPFHPSTHWAQGGPIFEAAGISAIKDRDEWWAGIEPLLQSQFGMVFAGAQAYGPTELIAKARAKVASVYGETVPDEVSHG